VSVLVWYINTHEDVNYPLKQTCSDVFPTVSANVFFKSF